MALVAKTLTLDITPGAIPQVVNVSEYDENRQYTVTLIDEGGVYAIPSGTTAKVEGSIGGNGFSESATVSGNTITFTLSESMTATAGDVWCKIKLVKDSKPIQTCAFILRVDVAGLESGTVTGADGFETLIHDAVETVMDEKGFVVDSTLSVSGSAADAKVTGEKIGDLKSALNNEIEITGNRVVLSQLGAENKMPFFAKSGDVLLADTVGGDDFTPSQIEFYSETGAVIKAFAILNYGYERKFVYDGTPDAYYAAIKGGTAQDVALVNMSSLYHFNLPEIGETVGELNYFAELNRMDLVGRKLFHAKNGDTIEIKTADGSNFTVQSVRYYDKSLTQLAYNVLTGYGNSRTVTLSVTDDVEWIDLGGGTAQGIIVTNKSSRYYEVPEKVKTIASDLDALETSVETLGNIVEKSLNGTRYITNLEIGSMSNGKPTISNAYVRAAGFIRANAGDIFTVSPVGFGLYYGVIYIYDTDNASGYNTSVAIPATTTGKTWSYTFENDCWFKFRASNASSGANITPQDLYNFNKVFHLTHVYDADELMNQKGAFGVNYDTLNSAISGKFNLAIQTDTHMAKYIGYTGEAYQPSDFDMLNSVAETINKLDVDVFANLGDFIRGYQCDPDYESRESADAMLEQYRKIRTNKAFVIGNHDDGCLYYHNGVYNDKQSVQQVMFPAEQFNRYIKFGRNQTGIKNYYYADINGVRIITLYQRDFNYSTAVPGIEAFKIGAEQLTWLTGTALDTDLPVIVLTHAPLVSSLYATSREGFDDVLTALASFVSGGGTVIAVLSGHTHAQNAAKVDGIQHIVFKNGYDFFEIVSVDLTTRAITCTPVNNSSLSARPFSY